MFEKTLKICLIGVTVCLMAGPVCAESEWDFYGSVRLSTFQDNFSKEASSTGKDRSNMSLDMNSNSRIGAKIKNDEFNAGFEYGSTPNLRKLFGRWKTEYGHLMIGQHYTPANIVISNQTHNGGGALLNVGGLYTGRNPQILFKTKIGLMFSAVKPNAYDTVGLGNTTTSLPAIEARYDFTAGRLSGGVVYGTKSFKSESTTKSVSVSASVMGAFARVKLGATKFAFNIISSTNPGNYGQWLEGGSTTATYDASTDSLTNATTTGFILVGSLTISETISFETGYGSQSNKSGISGDKEDETTAIYVQLPIKWTSAIFITPEIGFYDYVKDSSGTKKGSNTYFGVNWKFDF